MKTINVIFVEDREMNWFEKLYTLYPSQCFFVRLEDGTWWGTDADRGYDDWEEADEEVVRSYQEDGYLERTDRVKFEGALEVLIGDL